MATTSNDLVQLENRPSAGIGELLHRITDDVKTIASDEVELARVELSTNLRNVVIDSAVILLGAVVVLIGFGLLCTTAVVALEPVISSLALRLLIMSAVYLVLGGVIAAVFARKLKRGAQQTVHDVTDPLTH
ncbi:MAG TPA: phage holin family protein [Kofleriaceae bacterium]|jgi:uncharacterized membrane protein YqjE|nr:phage holin family protein [Kofleriaceae bacterium]